MEQKINKENIKNNLVFCIDPRKAFAIKSIPRSVFRNPSHKNKIRLFSISVKFLFRFLYKTITKQIVCIWTISQDRVDLDCNFWGSLPFKRTTVGEVWPLQWFIFASNLDIGGPLRCVFIVYWRNCFVSVTEQNLRVMAVNSRSWVDNF